jgi:hypothetical protein
MRQFSLAVFLAMLCGLPFPQPILAQSMQDVTTVACMSGSGCRCALSGISAVNMAWLLNQQEPPANADKLILLSVDGVTRWSALSPDRADADHGGDGVCPIEVFLPVEPEDGTWTGKVRAQDFSGCAPQVAEMVPGVVAGMTFSRQIAWNRRFDPAQLSADPASKVVSWSELHPNLFAGKLNSPVKSDVLKVSGALSARLTAPDRATATLRLRIGSSGKNAATLAALGMADCRVTAIYDFENTNP